MGYVTSIARSNEFKINNFDSFKNGLKDFIGGDREEELNYHYSEVKRRSRNATIQISSESFDTLLLKLERYTEVEEDGESIKKVRINYYETLELIPFIQEHLIENETCIIYHTEYEHAGDLEMYVHIITKYTYEQKDICDFKGGI